MLSNHIWNMTGTKRHGRDIWCGLYLAFPFHPRIFASWQHGICLVYRSLRPHSQDVWHLLARFHTHITLHIYCVDTALSLRKDRHMCPLPLQHWILHTFQLWLWSSLFQSYEIYAKVRDPTTEAWQSLRSPLGKYTLGLIVLKQHNIEYEKILFHIYKLQFLFTRIWSHYLLIVSFFSLYEGINIKIDYYEMRYTMVSF